MTSMTVEEMVAEAAADVRGVDPSQLEAYVFTGTAVVVDVREPEELDDHGLIAGATHAPRGLLEFWADPSSPSHRPGFDPDTTIILYCAAGARSALAARALQRLGYRDVAHLEGGIQAWKQAGKPVVGLASWHELGSVEAARNERNAT